MSSTDPRLELVQRFFAGTGPSYDRMVNAATLGIDRSWKRKLAALVPPDARRVLDLACGTGISTLSIARHRPNARIVGVELREEYLDIARRKVAGLGLGNVELVLSRAEDYRSDEPFDCITSSYLAKYADLPVLTRNCRAMLEPGGVLVMHDFTYPPHASLVAIWRAYFKVMQVASKHLFPGWREIYYGLPELIRATRWREELLQALRREGFVDIQSRDLFAYGSAIVVARRP